MPPEETTLTLEDLYAAREIYLLTLPDSKFSRDDWYDTPRGFAETATNEFFRWLRRYLQKREEVSDG